MTITEAAACGTPAVVSDVAGHADAVVDGRTGVLAPMPTPCAPDSTRSSATTTSAPASTRGGSATQVAVHVGSDRTRTLEVLAAASIAP